MENRLVEAADLISGEKLYERITELERINEQHREENGKLREVVRQQGEFIQSMKEMIADFVYGGDRESRSLGRLNRPFPTSTTPAVTRRR